MDKLLKEIITSFGVSGREYEIKDIIKREINKMNLVFKEDKLGNLIVKVGTGKEKVMICTHMDTAGIMATYIEDNGFIRVGKVGNIDYKKSINSYIKFNNGVIEKLCSTKVDGEEKDLYIDFFSKDKKIVEGDTACFKSEILECEDKILGSGISRIGCYALLNILKNFNEGNKEYYFVFSTQNELGGRGARAAAYDIKPDYCIVLDTENTDDIIEGDNRIKISNGVILRTIDKQLIIDEKIKNMVDNIVKENNIKIQYSVSKKDSQGGTIHKEVGGIPTGVIAIPCRYKYTPTEMVSYEDMNSTMELINKIIAND